MFAGAYRKFSMSQLRTLMVTTRGKDRVGLVRDVVGAIHQHKGSILDSQHMQMAGSFCGIIFVSVPVQEKSELERALANCARSFGIQVSTKEVTQKGTEESAGNRYYLKVALSGIEREATMRQLLNYFNCIGIQIEHMKKETTREAQIFRVDLRLGVPEEIEWHVLNRNLSAFAEKLQLRIQSEIGM